MRKNPVDSTFTLLSNYSFEPTETNINDLVFCWLSLYPSKWVVAAIVEAIYQGRYKVESVSRILNAWSMRGHPVHHFDYDFADVVCKKLANLGGYGMNNFSKRTGEEMTPLTQPLEQKERNKAVRKIKSAVPDFDSTGRPEKISKNIPNQKIGQCEKLVIHLSA